MADQDARAKQVAIAERLQTKLLERWERILANDTITPTEVATLTRMLMANGWDVDPSRLSQGLRDKLTAIVSSKDFEDADIRGH
jgi:hypothetical protein